MGREDLVEVVQGDVLRDHPCVGERRHLVEGRGEDVDDREQDEDRDADADEVPPPVRPTLGAPAPAAALGQRLSRAELRLFHGRHLIVSRAFDFQNAIPLIVATMKKITIEIAAASAKSLPLPDAKATLYV